MRFHIIPIQGRIPREGNDVGYLLTDSWDDWFEFSTQYILYYFDIHGVEHALGSVKIGQFGMKEKQRRPELPEVFERLDNRFFSLGQDADYYEKATLLEADIGNHLLNSLKDVVVDETLYLKARDERVMGVSLMRSVNERTLLGQFRRIVQGGVRLTRYSFEYEGPVQLDTSFERLKLSFAVEPLSKPPTNIQVIIGRNGVGKSFLLNAMSRALVYADEDADENGTFVDRDDIFSDDFGSPFSNVVSVTFSAFDDFPLISNRKNALDGIQYTNVGLRRRKRISDDEGRRILQTVTQEPNELTQDFITSAKLCAQGERRERWLRALRTLESDPIFEEAEVEKLLECEPERFGPQAGLLFRRLSSGHKIVLLTITKLVEKVEERTLVLMDEPEAHLHPPLLAALIRGVSDLLINRNGVAIMATHSPVVLQEVPRSCVWKVRRHGGRAIAERVRGETFAEHVGHLTHEVFGLEVTQSGFHKLIMEAIEDDDNFDTVSYKFEHEVGSEGRALISTLVAQRRGLDAEGEE